jgi:hypothetical protein
MSIGARAEARGVPDTRVAVPGVAARLAGRPDVRFRTVAVRFRTVAPVAFGRARYGMMR